MGKACVGRKPFGRYKRQRCRAQGVLGEPAQHLDMGMPRTEQSHFLLVFMGSLIGHGLAGDLNAIVGKRLLRLAVFPGADTI